MTTQTATEQVQKNPAKLMVGIFKKNWQNENRSLRLIKNHIEYLEQRLKNVSR